MGLLKNEYKSFLDDIEKNIKNKEDLNYVKQRFVTFMDSILDEIEDINNYKTEEINALQKNQKEVEAKLAKIQGVLDNIEKDIYAEDGFDFEITCPYCNYEFFIDVDENKTEVECPECNNIIELDWNGDVDDDLENNSGCSGSCGGCHGCGGNDDDDDM